MFQKPALLILMTAVGLALVPAASAATCSTDTLADYVANGSCTLGDLSFSNISASTSSTLSNLNTSQISVTAIPTVSDPGLQFNYGYDAVGTEKSQSTTVSFTVTDTAGTLINDITVSADSGFTGKGTAAFTETYCNVAFANLSGFNSNGCGVFSVTNAGNFSEILTLPTAVSSLTITKQLSFNAHGTGFTDTKDSAYGSFGASAFDPVPGLSPVPEPRSVSLLLGLGLAAGVLIAKRIQAARS